MYIVINSDNLDCLCGKVSAAMKENWKTEGGVSMLITEPAHTGPHGDHYDDKYLYLQAMVRGES